MKYKPLSDEQIDALATVFPELAEDDWARPLMEQARRANRLADEVRAALGCVDCDLLSNGCGQRLDAALDVYRNLEEP